MRKENSKVNRELGFKFDLAVACHSSDRVQMVVERIRVNCSAL